MHFNNLPSNIITRFAPSPTGYLHRGHILNAVYVWGIVQARGGEVVFRIEDHDKGRYRDEYETAIIEDMQWLGFEFGDVVNQRNRSKRYKEFLNSLEHIYACDCSRKDIASYQKENSNELWYNGICSNKNIPLDKPNTGIRLKLNTEDVIFDDLILNKQVQSPYLQCGDFLLRNKNKEWTYQMAVVCDDIDQDINTIIRGEDILESTGRQILLHKALNNDSIPAFMHHSLLYEKDGIKKLSKRQKSFSIRQEKNDGISPETIIGEVCFAAGLIDKPTNIKAAELHHIFA